MDFDVTLMVGLSLSSHFGVVCMVFLQQNRYLLLGASIVVFNRGSFFSKL
jgi:hypothetical protein